MRCIWAQINKRPFPRCNIQLKRSRAYLDEIRNPGSFAPWERPAKFAPLSHVNVSLHLTWETRLQKWVTRRGQGQKEEGKKVKLPSLCRRRLKGSPAGAGARRDSLYCAPRGTVPFPAFTRVPKGRAVQRGSTPNVPF